MDVRQLRYFVRVIELRSFSRAAEVLHIAQPALGMQIRKLEDELQTQLLARHSRGVEPTEAGNLLRDRAIDILRQIDATKQEVRDFTGPPRGIVNVGITPSTHPRIATELIQRSAIELPNIQIVVQETMNAMLLDWVRTERVDFGLVYFADGRPADLTADDLAEEHAVLVQAPQRGRGTPDTITLAEVCQLPIVMPGRPHHLRHVLEAAAERQGLEPDIAYEIESVSTILEMVERNIAACVLPMGAVAKHVDDGRLVASTIVAPRLTLTMSLVHSPRRTLSKAQVLLRGLITELVAAQPRHGPAEAPNRVAAHAG